MPGTEKPRWWEQRELLFRNDTWPMAIPCSLRATVTRYGQCMIDKLKKGILHHQASVTASSRQGRSQVGEDLAQRLRLSDNVSSEWFYFGVNSYLDFEFSFTGCWVWICPEVWKWVGRVEKPAKWASSKCSPTTWGEGEGAGGELSQAAAADEEGEQK